MRIGFTRILLYIVILSLKMCKRRPSNNKYDFGDFKEAFKSRKCLSCALAVHEIFQHLVALIQKLDWFCLGYCFINFKLKVFQIQIFNGKITMENGTCKHFLSRSKMYLALIYSR